MRLGGGQDGARSGLYGLIIALLETKLNSACANSGSGEHRSRIAAPLDFLWIGGQFAASSFILEQ